jgi:hypothetical protein
MTPQKGRLEKEEILLTGCPMGQKVWAAHTIFYGGWWCHPCSKLHPSHCSGDSELCLVQKALTGEDTRKSLACQKQQEVRQQGNAHKKENWRKGLQQLKGPLLDTVLSCRVFATVLYRYGQASITKSHRLGDLNNRNLFSYCFGGWRAEMQVSQG